IILVLKSTASASNRLDTSHDAQIIDVYLTSDVAASANSSTSNNGVDTYFPAVTTAGPPAVCGFTPVGYFSGLVTFHCRDSDTASPTGQSDKYAWYYLTRSAANVAPGVLHRSFCSVSVAAVPARVGVVRNYTLARDV